MYAHVTLLTDLCRQHVVRQQVSIRKTVIVGESVLTITEFRQQLLSTMYGIHPQVQHLVVHFAD